MLQPATFSPLLEIASFSREKMTELVNGIEKSEIYMTDEMASGMLSCQVEIWKNLYPRSEVCHPCAYHGIEEFYELNFPWFHAFMLLERKSDFLSDRGKLKRLAYLICYELAKMHKARYAVGA